MLGNPPLALTFDDVLLVPQASSISPANTDICSQLTRDIKLKTPFLSAAMDTVTEAQMALAMAEAGGLGVIHKNMTIQEQVEEVLRFKSASSSHCAVAVGWNSHEDGRTASLLDAGANIIFIDSAHGHSMGVINAVKETKKRWGKKYNFQLIAGNAATGDAAKALIEAGVDAVKVGIGPGSICTTRIVAGVGVPQITAIADCFYVADPYGIPIIADGGIKYSGDIVKAIAAGASTIMLGSLLAGTEEAPGETILVQGRSYKSYRGMGSLGAMTAGSSDRYSQSPAQKFVPEGIEGRVPYKGTVADNIYQLVGGLRSGMGYVGAANIAQLQYKSKFVRITSAGLRESHVHDVTITNEAPNYHVG